MNPQKYLQAGYTHLVEYITFSKILSMYVNHSFPTTADAVKRAVAGLSANPTVSRNSIKVTKLVELV